MPRAENENTTRATNEERERMLAGLMALRLRAEEAAEMLISLLDELDGDADLDDICEGCEPDEGEEPWLGWPLEFSDVDQSRGCGITSDCEGPQDDFEPSLGWPESRGLGA